MIPAPTGIKIFVGGETNLEIAEAIKQEFTKIKYQCDVVDTKDAKEIIFQVNSK